MIKFKLTNIEDIQPWGETGHRRLHWFGLTDGKVYLDFNGTQIYASRESTASHVPINYVEYEIVRFIEDFSELFSCIGESIPKDIYDLSANLKKFIADAEAWREQFGSNDDMKFHFDFYIPLTSWVHDRHLSSNHLINGPDVYFFRHEQNIRIVWEVDGKTKSGERFWTAPCGQVVMPYSAFLTHVADFGHAFFEDMGTQVIKAIEKDWGDVKLDQTQLVEEHESRKTEFFNTVNLLNSSKASTSDWKQTLSLMSKMRDELGG